MTEKETTLKASANASTTAESINTGPSSSAKVVIREMQLGVWRLLFIKEGLSLRKMRQSLQEAVDAFSDVRHFMLEIFALAPLLLCFYAAGTLWLSVDASVILYLSQKLLFIIENGILSKDIRGSEVMKYLFLYLFARAVTSSIRRSNENISTQINQRVQMHYEESLLEARLRLDLASAEDTSNKDLFKSSPFRNIWRTFHNFFAIARQGFSALTQLILVSKLLELDGIGSLVFLTICVIKPVLDVFLARSLGSMPYVAQATNKAHLRMVSLKKLASLTEHRQEVIGDGLGPLILNGYREAKEQLGDVSQEHPHIQYSTKNSSLVALTYSFLSELPMIFYAARSILHPESFSVASLYTLQQLASQLERSFRGLLSKRVNLSGVIQDVVQLKRALTVQSKMKDGGLPYPTSEYGDTAGMAVEFRHVTFDYPESKANKNALQDVSFSIGSGQLVVVVGANGSGKSSLIKLLTRLYDPTSGEILIDGYRIEAYHLPDLRRTTGILSQDHTIFPLSIAENIGLGYTGASADQTSSEVEEAARLGGSLHFISKFDNGFSTVLNPPSTTQASGLAYKEDSPLKPIYDKLEKQSTVSGGEKQRLVASRAFMRLKHGSLRLLAVDEPSSALDPEGEYQLFKRLRECSEGRTMLFVTHRFGHLTKHADLILCMKEGELVEQGTHEKLLALNGEYAKLYNVQAQAFAS